MARVLGVMLLEEAKPDCCAFAALPGNGLLSSANALPEAKADLPACPLPGLASSSGTGVPAALPAGVCVELCGLRKLLLVALFSCPVRSEGAPRFVPLRKGLGVGAMLPEALLSMTVSFLLAWNLMGVCFDLVAQGAGRLGAFSRASSGGRCSCAESTRSGGEPAGVESAIWDAAGVDVVAAAAAAASASAASAATRKSMCLDLGMSVLFDF